MLRELLADCLIIRQGWTWARLVRKGPDCGNCQSGEGEETHEKAGGAESNKYFLLMIGQRVQARDGEPIAETIHQLQFLDRY